MRRVTGTALSIVLLGTLGSAYAGSPLYRGSTSQFGQRASDVGVQPLYPAEPVPHWHHHHRPWPGAAQGNNRLILIQPGWDADTRPRANTYATCSIPSTDTISLSPRLLSTGNWPKAWRFRTSWMPSEAATKLGGVTPHGIDLVRLSGCRKYVLPPRRTMTSREQLSCGFRSARSIVKWAGFVGQTF